jgi:hypothetical protein
VSPQFDSVATNDFVTSNIFLFAFIPQDNTL